MSQTEICRIPLRVVFYYEEDCWFARCLEFDLIGSGNSKEEALELLKEAIELQAQASIESDNLANLISPAAAKYHVMWFIGKHVVVGELKIPLERIEIDGIDAREFGNGLTCA